MDSDSIGPANEDIKLSIPSTQPEYERPGLLSEKLHQSTFSSATTVNESPISFKKSDKWNYSGQEPLEATPDNQETPDDCIESKYPRGYPGMAAFMDLEPKFDMFRRFGRLRIRILLKKQDELQELQERLDLVDSQDKIQLHLSSRRYDRNRTRKELLDLIEQKLAEYDEALLRHQRLLGLGPVAPRNAKSFVNWMEGNRPLVEIETRFMKDIEDFVPSSQQDLDYGFLDSAIEWLLPKLCCGCACIFSPKSLRRKSSYKYLHLYSAPRISRLIRLLVTILAVKSLLIPIVLLYYIRESQARLYIVLSFTIGISLILSGCTNASRYEIFAATAAYCAVLVVFLGSVSP